MCKFYDADGNYLPNLFNWPGETNEMKLPNNFEKMKAFCDKFYEKTKIKYIKIDFMKLIMKYILVNIRYLVVHVEIKYLKM